LKDVDVTRTAALHRQSLPDSFFARLGGRFLQTYHRTYAHSPHAVALVSVDGALITGFLLGVSSPVAHGNYVLRTWGLRMALFGIVAMCRRPDLLVLFVRTRARRYARGLYRRWQTRPVPTAQPEAVVAVLSHLAVDPEVRRSGAGRLLVEHFRSELTARDVSSLQLLTAPHGAGAEFYRRLHFIEQGTITGADGARWLRFSAPSGSAQP